MQYLGKRRMYELAIKLFRCDDTASHFSKCVDSHYSKYRGMEWLTVYGNQDKYILCVDKCGAYLSVEVYDCDGQRIRRQVLNGFGKYQVAVPR